jgi:hypothetical protein
VRTACGEAGEFPLEQTTLGRNNPPSSDHAGNIVRAQNASPIPRSDAHTSVAANGQAVRFRCGDDGRLAAMVADAWFELDTGQDPDWRMMRSRPVPRTACEAAP